MVGRGFHLRLELFFEVVGVGGRPWTAAGLSTFGGRLENRAVAELIWHEMRCATQSFMNAYELDAAVIAAGRQQKKLTAVIAGLLREMNETEYFVAVGFSSVVD